MRVSVKIKWSSSGVKVEFKWSKGAKKLKSKNEKVKN